MNELDAIVQARRLISETGIDEIPVDINKLLSKVDAVLRPRSDLREDESGHTMEVGGVQYIVVNSNHSIERQRFTILHEVAHIVLKLPSQHESTSLGQIFGGNSGRPREEIICDLFAAECLLPKIFFESDVENVSATFSDVRELSDKYLASVHCTASRLVDHIDEPCSFVFSSAGVVRFARASAAMRESGGFVEIGKSLPKDTVAWKLRNERQLEEEGDSRPASEWFDNQKLAAATVYEESIFLSSWDQTLTLLSDLDVDEEEKRADSWDDEEPALRELDGRLPWPGKSRRR